MNPEPRALVAKQGFAWPVVLHVTLKPISERHAITAAVFGLAGAMLLMAREDPKLWDIELFKIILQAVIISGIFGSIVAFHFTASKGDEAKTENTARAFDAIRAVQGGAGAADAATQAADQGGAGAADAATQAADQVARAAADEAATIEGEAKK